MLRTNQNSSAHNKHNEPTYTAGNKQQQQPKSLNRRASSAHEIYDFEDIYDLYAIRIVVNKIEECYLSLGLDHSLFKPIQELE